MEHVFYILTLSSLLLIFLQDFKERKVYVLTLVVSAIGTGSLHFYNSEPYVFLTVILSNFFLLFIVLSTLWLYTKLILKKEFKDSIGTGDLFFFFILALGFPSATFLILFVSSLLFSLLIFKIIERKLKSKLIPLAGLQALFLMLIFLSNSCFHFSNLYSI